MTVVLAVVFLLAVLAFNAVWPPRWAPEVWRGLTRPLRRRVRPRHYR